MTKATKGIDWAARQAQAAEYAEITSRGIAQDGAPGSAQPDDTAVALATPERSEQHQTASDEPVSGETGDGQDATPGHQPETPPANPSATAGGGGIENATLTGMTDVLQKKQKVQKQPYNTQVTDATGKDVEAFLKEEDLLKTDFTDWALRLGMQTHRKLKEQGLL